MKSRVEKLINSSCAGLWIGTFHSLCARMLRREARSIGYSSAFSIYDTTDQLSVIKRVMKELQIDEKTMQPKHLLNAISNHKNECVPPADLESTDLPLYKKYIVDAYTLYQRELKKDNAMDFDDLITNMVYIFRKNQDILAGYRKQFAYILVDEYQDTNTSQFLLVQLLALPRQNIFVVGDDDQSIYSWRGARIENILSFERVFPSARVFKLEQNYRSHQAILDFANAIIDANKNRAQKKLWTAKKEGSEIIVTRYRDERQEAECVADKVQILMTKNIPPGTIAILFRTNAQSRPFEEAFRKRNIRYVIVGGMSFYERKEIKDCLAYLRLLVNPHDSISCERILNVPARGIGAKSQERLAEITRTKSISLFDAIMAHEYGDVSGSAARGLDEFASVFSLLRESAGSNTPPHEILTQMLTITGYVEDLEQNSSEESHSRLENINELLNVLTVWDEENPGRTLADFLEEISLATDIDGWKQEDGAVNCMTFHAAKGLEFTAVFLAGIEDGLIPAKQNFDQEWKLEEECRLFYVGATRAMKFLECSYVDTRMRFGMVMPMEQSRYLERVSTGLYRFVDQSLEFIPKMYQVPVQEKKHRPQVHEQNVTRSAKQYVPYDDFTQDTVQFRKGQAVIHNKYGQGKITAISGFGVDMQLTILFQDGSKKNMMAKFANLQAM